MVNPRANNPPIVGWLSFRATLWMRARGENPTPDLREELAPVEFIPGLTRRMARGEETAFREFHEAYFHRLFRYLLVMSGGHEEMAKDALQATLVRVARHKRPFDSEAVFWSWLTILARSAFLDEQRKRRRYRSLLDRFLSHFAATTDRAAVHPVTDAELVNLLEENLATLPPDDRALLESKYYDAQSVRDIAARSGCSEKAVESRLGRVRSRLKQRILTQLKDED